MLPSITHTIPVVNIWPDIASEASTEGVFDPAEFTKQYHTMVKIVQESKERTKVRALSELDAQLRRDSREYARASDSPAIPDNAPIDGNSTQPLTEGEDSRVSLSTGKEHLVVTWRRLWDAARSVIFR
ncbi:hypothetical protein BD413DRAFT_611880 [Trametes elegans]|nr:hypothetical protein BD413DRAFT_611880 [Trametes elegans]